MRQGFTLQLYYKVYRISAWVKQHFTLTGHLVLMFMTAAAVFGVDTKQSSTYQLFVFLAVLVVFSWLASRINRLNVTLTRRLPRYGMAGEPLNYTVTLTNSTAKSYDGLALGKQLTETLPGPAQLKRFYRLETRPWFKQVITYRRWRQYLLHQRGGAIVETRLPDLGATPLTIKISFIPVRRGAIHFGSSYLAAPDALGLFRRLFVLEAPQTCWVLPKHYPLRTLPLAGKRKFQPGGVSLANSVGNSSEFRSTAGLPARRPAQLYPLEELCQTRQTDR